MNTNYRITREQTQQDADVELIFHVARDANSMRPGQEPERDFEVTAKFIDYVEIRSSQFSEEGGQ